MKIAIVNGYITWTKSNYAAYFFANATEFSDRKVVEVGWSNYGDLKESNN